MPHFLTQVAYNEQILKGNGAAESFQISPPAGAGNLALRGSLTRRIHPALRATRINFSRRFLRSKWISVVVEYR